MFLNSKLAQSHSDNVPGDWQSPTLIRGARVFLSLQVQETLFELVLLKSRERRSMKLLVVEIL